VKSKRLPAAFAALVFIIGILAPLAVEARKGGGGGKVNVRGYYRKDGTYVRPHTRTAPDGNPHNNYSLPGNYNPNKGEITPGDPDKYLERYYNRSSSPRAIPPSSYIDRQLPAAPPPASSPPSPAPPRKLQPASTERPAPMPRAQTPQLGSTQGPYRIRLKNGTDIVADTYNVRGQVFWAETNKESIGLPPSDVLSITPLFSPR
jgi:hypothetical protein